MAQPPLARVPRCVEDAYSGAYSLRCGPIDRRRRGIGCPVPDVLSGGLLRLAPKPARSPRGERLASRPRLAGGKQRSISREMSSAVRVTLAEPGSRGGQLAVRSSDRVELIL
jgi:hypothetical protein